jgi:hypothetical protein
MYNDGFIQKIKHKYTNLKNLTNKFVGDVDNLYVNTFTSVKKLVNHCLGEYVYSDFCELKQGFSNGLSNLKDDFKTLENILFKKNAKNHLHNFSPIRSYTNYANLKFANYDPNVNKSCIIESYKRTPKSNRNSSIDSVVHLNSNSSNDSSTNLINDTTFNTDTFTANTLNTASLNNYASKFSAKDLSNIIALKNKYFGKSNNYLENLIKIKLDKQVSDINLLLKDAMLLKLNNANYCEITSIYYDSRIAPDNMKEDIVNLYIASDKSLNYISAFLEKKYGMHIATSTISVNARKYFLSKGNMFKNRKDAKKWYLKR